MRNEFQIHRMKHFFGTGASQDPAFRAKQLRALSGALETFEQQLHAALYADLHKSPIDAYASETGFVQSEIRYALKHLHRWSRPRRAAIPAGLFPAHAQIVPEPKGIALILGPWNYPVQLILSPLVSALAAGNCAVLKPSEYAPHTSAILRTLIEQTFPPDMLHVAEGDQTTAERLLDQPFDHIFFTGGSAAGRCVMTAAARRLIPVTLELGGKSPAILCADADLPVAARRIARGKFLNAGQTCVAPDHVWVPRHLTDAFTAQLHKTILQFYGADPQQSPDYGRIINRHHFDRLLNLYADCICDAETLYIAPTLTIDPLRDSALMQEELFGPILPILPYDSVDEIVAFNQNRPTPLALYLFTTSKPLKQRLLRAIPSGGACINDTVNQLIPKGLPFGGRGASGMGACHGKAGFDTFSHFRSILTRSTRFDFPALYPPMRISLSTLKKGYRLFSGS